MFLRSLQNPVSDVTPLLLMTPRPSHCLICLDDNWGAWSWKSQAVALGQGGHVPDGGWELMMGVTQRQG